MSLCWKIYHFFHHKFSKNSNYPPQMHWPVFRIDIRRKKNCAKKCLFWPPRGCEKMVIFHTWHLQKKIILISSHFANEPWEPWNTLPNSHRSDLKQKIPKLKKVWILKFLNMSLCWKIYHFFHHKFSKNSNYPPQMHWPVFRIDIRRKKNCAKKCLFWPPRGCEKMVIFHTWHLQKKSFLFLRILPMNPGSHEIHSQIAIGVI